MSHKAHLGFESDVVSVLILHQLELTLHINVKEQLFVEKTQTSEKPPNTPSKASVLSGMVQLIVAYISQLHAVIMSHMR